MEVYGNINFIGLVKKNDRYVFFYDDDSNKDLIEVFNRFASDTDLSFNQHDETVLSNIVSKRVEKSMLNYKKRLDDIL